MSHEFSAAPLPLSCEQKTIVESIVTKRILEKTLAGKLSPLLCGLAAGALALFIFPYYPEASSLAWPVAGALMALSLVLVPLITNRLRRKAITDFMRVMTKEDVVRRSVHVDMGDILILAECQSLNGEKGHAVRATVSRAAFSKILRECEAQGIPLKFDKLPARKGGLTISGKVATGTLAGVAISR